MLGCTNTKPRKKTFPSIRMCKNFTMLPQAGEFPRAFLWQRCGFAIATSVDWPLAQLIGIGAILIATSRTGQVKAKVVGVGED